MRGTPAVLNSKWNRINRLDDGNPFLLLDEIARRTTDGRMDDGQRYKKGPPRRLSLKKSSENDSEDKMVEGFTTNSQWKGFLPYFSLILGEA